MTLSEDNRKTLLIHLHKIIEETASIHANHINHGRTDNLIDYPPNGGLTELEKSALELLKKNEVLRDALRKVLANNSASVLFDLFNVIDGTADPDPGTGKWSEVILADKPKDYEGQDNFLHDAFYGTYWDWREKRKANFKLDLLDD